MEINYSPYTITDKMLNLVAGIMEKIGEANYFENLNRFPELRRKTRIKSIHSSGDLVYIHNLVKSNLEDKGSAAIDIFRFENGKIVEHWDVIQPMPESSANDHPMF